MTNHIIVPAVSVPLSSNNNTYKIRLNKDADHEKIIPQSHDIIKTCIAFPNEVDEVRLIFDKFTQQHLESFPVHVSLVLYMYVDIEFAYNKDYLMQHEEFTYMDEYKEVETHGEVAEIYDGYEYHT